MPGQGALNPGGVPKGVREARRRALEDLPTAQAWVRNKLHGRDAEGNPAQVSADDMRLAVQMTYERALGKAGKPSELPSLEEPTTPRGATTEDLLRQVRTAYEHAVGDVVKQQAAGEVGQDVLERLASLASGLNTLAKTEREVAAGNGLAALPLEDLKRVVVGLMPLDDLQSLVALKQAEEKKP